MERERASPNAPHARLPYAAHTAADSPLRFKDAGTTDINGASSRGTAKQFDFVALTPLRRSRHIPEGMPERVAGTRLRNRERELARG